MEFFFIENFVVIEAECFQCQKRFFFGPYKSYRNSILQEIAGFVTSISEESLFACQCCIVLNEL